MSDRTRPAGANTDSGAAGLTYPAAIGGALLAAGVLLLVVVRRRQQRPAFAAPDDDGFGAPGSDVGTVHAAPYVGVDSARGLAPGPEGFSDDWFGGPSRAYDDELDPRETTLERARIVDEPERESPAEPPAGFHPGPAHETSTGLSDGVPGGLSARVSELLGEPVPPAEPPVGKAAQPGGGRTGWRVGAASTPGWSRPETSDPNSDPDSDPGSKSDPGSSSDASAPEAAAPEPTAARGPESEQASDPGTARGPARPAPRPRIARPMDGDLDALVSLHDDAVEPGALDGPDTSDAPSADSPSQDAPGQDAPG